MTTLRKAAQQALEALYQAREHVTVHTDGPWQQVENDCHAAIAALRAALAQEQAGATGKQPLQVASEPVPQPGVWMHPWPPVRAQEPTPPPEAVTEAEKTAYAAGWWAAMARRPTYD